MDALILAGGPAPPELCSATGCTDRALISLDGQPMVARVLDALRTTRGMEKIVVVASSDTHQAVTGVVAVEAGGRMVDNLQRGLAATSSESVLVCTCDIPLVTAATFEDFMRLATARHLELAYPIVRRATSEAAFPGGQRTYARISDGEFTGGNAVIVPRRIIGQVVELIDVAYNARKNPMALAKILGPAFVMKFLSKRLSIAEVELKASRVLNCRAGAVEMQDAAIAFDVDKPGDLDVARQALSSRGG
jgi:GTP:adenosylcobinamide-phosphate guanylyltransferase